MAVSTTTTLTETIRTEAIGGAVLGFDSRPGVASLVERADLSGMPTETHVFPIIDNISAAAVAEGSNFTDVQTLDTTGSASASVSEHAIMAEITDKSIRSSQEDWLGSPEGAVASAAGAAAAKIGQMSVRALIKLRDQDLAGLFSALNSSTGSNSGPLTAALVNTATSILEENDIPDDRVAMVLHPTQVRSLIPVFDDASTFGAAGAAVINRGQAGFGMLYGAQMFRTTNVATATVSASTVYAGAVFDPSAIGLVTKGPMPMIELERDASARQTQVISVAEWGEIEYRGGATTNGRGGAGVYLYSNTTN